MPALILHYGPYEAYGLIKHRHQRLHGLLTYLNEKRYEVEIVPSDHPNRLAIEMEGSEIFRCDIRFLLFNMDYVDDPVCQRAIAAIEEATSRIYHEDNIPKFVSVKEGRRYMEKCKHLTTRDYLSPSVGLLYEHQTQFKDKPKDESASFICQYLRTSLQDQSEIEEEQTGDLFDEYADWDFASTIIRGIIETLPVKSESSNSDIEPSSDKTPFSFAPGASKVSVESGEEDGIYEEDTIEDVVTDSIERQPRYSTDDEEEEEAVEEPQVQEDVGETTAPPNTAVELEPGPEE